MPDIELFVNRFKYSGWKSASVTRTIDALSGKFEVDTSDKWETGGQRWTIFPDDACSVSINGETMITGWVDKTSPSYDATTHGIKVSGRDKSGDLVDSSVEHNISELRGLKLEGIIAALIKPYGLKVTTQVDTGAVFPVFAIQPCETVWEAMERALKQRFMICNSTPQGDLVISDIGATRAHDALIEGENIKAASGDYDNSQRFSVYFVIGQSATANDGWEDPKTNIQSQAKDENIKRYRPKSIQADTQASEGSAENRAKLEAATRAGKATKLTVTVKGWTMTNGELWPLNSIVKIRSPYLSIDTEMLISSTEFSISNQSGQETKIELTRPDAYLLGQGKVKKGKKQKDGVGVDHWEEFEDD